MRLYVIRMALQLENKELQQVQAKRKPVRPSYYSADLGVDIEISEDFEAVLILLPSSAKQQVQQAINRRSQPDQAKRKRDTILKAALAVDLEVANAQIDEATSTLQQNDTVTNSLRDPRFMSVPETKLLMDAVQASSDELLLQRQRAKHNGVMATLIGRSIDTDQDSRLATQYASLSDLLRKYMT